MRIDPTVHNPKSSKMKRWWVTLALASGLVAPPAMSLPHTGEFAYSNLCWEKESGDAAGYRVRLVRSANGDQLYLEWSDGPLEGPTLAENLKVDAKTSSISFTIPRNPLYDPPPDNFDTYKGRVSARSMVLNGQRLPRVKSAMAKLRECK
jgi:hypothetical protein